jgi:hypothetical protein
MLPSTNVFIYCKEYSDTEHSFTYPSEKLLETVDTAVTIMECTMAEVAHLNSVEQHITAAIKNSVDFEWIRCTGYSLHHQQIVNSIVISLTRVYIPWWCKQVNRLKSGTVRHRATRRKMQILAY